VKIRKKEKVMNKVHALFLILTLAVLSGCSKELQLDESGRIAELDAYWAEVSRCVKEGDFDGYKATCHKDGVIVSGWNDRAYPLSKALARWEQDFTDAKAGKTKTSVEFRFSKRLGDSTTAHETGMFLYTKVDADGAITKDYVDLEALLLKRGTWKIIMEHQKSDGTEEQWNKLK
jgi:hypothetical protein